MAEQERTVYGDRNMRVTMNARHVFFDRSCDASFEDECVLSLTRAQFDEIVRGYEREKEQLRDGRQ